MGPKKLLDTKISKKGCLSGEKKFWPISSRIIECEKLQKTIHKGSQGRLTFQKNLSPGVERFWPIFLLLLSITNVKEHFVRVDNVF